MVGHGVGQGDGVAHRQGLGAVKTRHADPSLKEHILRRALLVW
jgi:hypothetical protein